MSGNESSSTSNSGQSDECSDDQWDIEFGSALSRYLSQMGDDSDSDEESSDDCDTVDSNEEESDEQHGKKKFKPNDEHTGECSDESGSSPISGKSSNPVNELPIVTDRPKWLDSIKTFVEETRSNSLDLSNRQIKRGEIVSVFNALTKSQVTEINLYDNNLKNEVKHFAKLLAQTKLKKLNFTSCELTSDDVTWLMEAVKDSEVTDLDLGWNNIIFDVNLMVKFVSHLLQSKLTHLNFMMNMITNAAGGILAQSLPNSSLTMLNLRGIMTDAKSHSFVTSIILNLPRCAITDLNLCGNRLSSAQLDQLSEILKDSKLEKLDLHGNNLCDSGVNILTRGLAHSRITELVLSCNRIKGNNNLGQQLKQTQIKTLDLSGNEMKHDKMFSFPDFSKGSALSKLILNECYLGDEIGQKLMKSLRSTEITELDVGYNAFGPASILEFCKSVKFTNITEVHFTSNDLSDEGIYCLGDCLKESKLENVGLFDTCESLDSNAVAEFLEKTKASSVVYLDLSLIKFKFNSTVAKSLENTTFTHFYLNDCKLSLTDISCLGSALKFTSVTHLELRSNSIGDESIKIFAEYLKETQVVSLDVSRNSITSSGVKALANALKDTNLQYLILEENDIKDDGLHYLAEQISSTFIIVLHAGSDYGSRESLSAIDTVLWKNRKIVQQLIDTFKRIVPEAEDSNFRFDSSFDSPDFSSFLEECLVLYNTVVKRPLSVNILAQEKSFSLSKTQITTLMLDEFPGQFAMFIGRSVNAEVTQHVDFLKRTEELGLNNLTELLLLNRPLYVLDNHQNILHPYAYKLMAKYKQPIVSLSIEPGGKEKLINYFIGRGELEGAADVVNLLCQTANSSMLEDQNS